MALVETPAAAARPQLIRAMNARVVLDCLRRTGPMSRADLGAQTGLSNPTVGLALTSLQEVGLVRQAGRRNGVPGRAASLYAVRPDAGFVLALDVGRRYVRGSVTDMSGATRARLSSRTKANGGPARVSDLVTLASSLLDGAKISPDDVTQTVVGSPGIYDPRRDVISLAGGLPGWGSPKVPAGLRDAFGPDVMIENDIDAAALAESAHGHGQGAASLAFISIGTGIGMGLVVDGKLHRGAHGAAGEIGFLPFSGGHGTDATDAHNRGDFEAAASAAAVVRAAKREGVRRPVSAQKVFASAAVGDRVAAAIVEDEAALVAQAVCATVAVMDPEIIVLGGGIGRAPGFIDAVATRARAISPVPTQIKVSALGDDAVVHGCRAAGLDRAWEILTSAIPAP